MPKSTLVFSEKKKQFEDGKMASYGIFRVEKLKKISNLRGSLMHAFREQKTDNADPSRTPDNVLLTADAYDVESTLLKYENLKPTGKIRADVVRAIEVMVTASPEAMKAMKEQEREAYLKKSLDFCNAQFGKGNLLHAQIHNDETTAHLTAFYIPVIEKKNKKGVTNRKLNASEILGGKKEYSERQTAFYEQVSKHYGLERGEVGSKAEHKRVLEWYKELNADKNSASVSNIIEEVASKGKTVFSCEVEESKEFLGFSYGVDKVEKTVSFSVPMISINDVKNVLTPYQNSNSEMARREREALKRQAKRELRSEIESEIKAKFEVKELALEKKAKEVEELKIKTNKVWRFFNKYHGEIASKLGMSIDGNANVKFSEIRDFIYKRVSEISDLVKENKNLKEFKKSVEDEIDLWTYDDVRTGITQKVFFNFDDYRKHFAKLNRESFTFTEKEKELNKVKREKSLLSDFKNTVSSLVSKFLDNPLEITIDSLEKAVKKVTDIAEKITDPYFIKKKYELECTRMLEENRSFIVGSLERAMDLRLSYSDRERIFLSAENKLNELCDYTNDNLPNEFLDLYDEALDKLKADEHLKNLPKMKMY